MHNCEHYQCPRNILMLLYLTHVLDACVIDQVTRPCAYTSSCVNSQTVCILKWTMSTLVLLCTVKFNILPDYLALSEYTHIYAERNYRRLDNAGLIFLGRPGFAGSDTAAVMLPSENNPSMSSTARE